MITTQRTHKTSRSNQSVKTGTGITVFGCEPDEADLFREIAPRYGMVPTITNTAISEITASLATGSRCISVSHKTHLTRPILRALSQAGVTYISTRSAGKDHIDMAYAQSLGISVGNVSYSPDSVADYTVMLILMVLRDTKSVMERVAVQDFRLNTVRGKELRDMTVGVVGTGRIGAAVIQRLQGFGCKVVAYDHHPKIAAEYVSLDELVRQSDIITLHTPLTDQTYHLLDRQRIAQMKPGAFVINTGRGALLDTAALIATLESGTLGGAALDVLEGEEGTFYADYRQRPVTNKLLLRLQKLPNVIITPHAAYHTSHALRDIVENTIINCLEFEKENAL